MSLGRLQMFKSRLQRRRRIQRICPLLRLRDRHHPVEWFMATEFKDRFHMYKETAIFVVSLIAQELSAPLKRGVYIPPILQFLTVVRFYSTGQFQLSTADHHQVTQPTVSNLVRRVSKALAQLRSQFIKYPTTDNATRYKQKFFAIANFPGVVGATDCTHVPIISPGGDDPELFRNRKGVFSINVHAICDTELNFLNIVARWYGSAHDSRIFENSSIFDEIENGVAPGMLVGDGGYTLLPFLMTPFERPKTRAERRLVKIKLQPQFDNQCHPQLVFMNYKYNTAQIKTRNCIERAFGILKRRFPCLKMLRLKLQTNLTVIVAATVLHNITRQRRDIFLNDDFVPQEDDNKEILSEGTARGKAVRLTIVQNNFT